MKQTSITMLVVPLQAVPSQTLSVILASQNCRINVYQKSTGLFLDLFVNDVALMTTVLCRGRLSMTSKASMGFVGDLFFKDLLGAADPDYTGLGTRFLLCHMVPAPGY
jgi:hypothetical protein